MLFRMLKKDLVRNKGITIALFVFIMLSALLVSSGFNTIVELITSIDHLFAKSGVPDFVQMHAGEVDMAVLESWASGNTFIREWQIEEMVTIDGSTLFMGDNNVPETSGVMDISFVKQNASFDYLLDLQSEVIQLSPGEIAVPIYYMQRDDLKIGDIISLSVGEQRVFRVAGFVRDALMNPAVVHSKRFVVSDDDFAELKSDVSEVEYLVAFQLNDSSTLAEFERSYQAANLPNKGPALTYRLFKMMNAIADGIVAAVIILISILLIIIALVSLRFTMLATIEEDYREIGAMKAIGMALRDIQQLYLVKYFTLAAVACATGYFLSLLTGRLFTKNIMLYIGSAPKGIVQYALPLVAVGGVLSIVVILCRLTLRRFNKITAVQALRTGSMGDTNSSSGILPLANQEYLNVNVFMGLRDVFGRMKMFILLGFVFIVCSFIIIVPINFLNTIKSPSFIKYMGIGRSDLRIDLHNSNAESFAELLAHVKSDPETLRYSALVTSQYRLVNSDGEYENISIETGDFSVFPLEYLRGSAPASDGQIALSYLNGKEMDKDVGDVVPLFVDGQVQELVVSGIYQDVTNGGRTAKAILPVNHDSVLWYVVSLDLMPHANIHQKMVDYKVLFQSARVTHLEGYLSQTLGGNIKQLGVITALAVVIALSISFLITALFLKLLVAKDSSQIAIMKSIGFSTGDIRLQYITRALLVLGVGIIVGTILSNTLGQTVISMLWSFMGASKVQFVIMPLQAYVLSPLALMAIVSITTLLSTASIKESNIAKMILE